MNNIDVVIATFNGEKYIREQLESIVNAECFDKYINEVIISDDNSTDETIREILSIKNKRIRVIKNNRPRGVINNFENSIINSKSKYVILSDQDDIWKKNKITCLISGIKKLERDNSKPALYFSDLIVTDEKMNTLYTSFWKSQRINPDNCQNITDLLFRNVAPGCSMIINRALIKASLPFPRDVLMHDWWLILVAKSLGSVGFSNETTLFYRQHENNVLGIKKMTNFQILKRIMTSGSDTFNKCILQAKALSKVLPETHPQYEFIEKISDLDRLNFMSRVGLFSKVKSDKISIKGNLILLMQFLIYKKR